MYKILLVISVVFMSLQIQAQELKCKVVVNADRIQDGNKSVFKTLEKSLQEFINQTRWTDKTYEKQERIDCSMVFTILKRQDVNDFSGTLQVQSSRPVYNSIYTTPVFNYQDKQVHFNYTEFEPLRFDKNNYQSELISLVSYYAYLIIGLDADTFSLNGGTDYYRTAQDIVNQIETPNGGWDAKTNQMNRYNMIKELLDNQNAAYRKTLYDYHIKGFDKMADNLREGKNAVFEAIKNLEKVYNNNMTSYVLRLFADAKADEIVSTFSAGPHMDTRKLVLTLNKIAPTMANKWSEIK